MKVGMGIVMSPATRLVDAPTSDKRAAADDD